MVNIKRDQTRSWCANIFHAPHGIHGNPLNYYRFIFLEIENKNLVIWRTFSMSPGKWTKNIADERGGETNHINA